MSLSRLIVAGLLLACSSQSDAGGQSSIPDVRLLDSIEIPIITRRDTVRVMVEVARTPDQHTMGLMERPSLAAHRGMLFLYPAVQSESTAFWMFRTRIPLDIAFIDSAGTIRTIKTMTPCTSTLAVGCESYPAEARYQAAMEVNAGFFARRGVRVGDRIPEPGKILNVKLDAP